MKTDTRPTPFLQLVEKPLPASLERCLEMFLLHQEAAFHTPRTIGTYRETLSRFLEFLGKRNIEVCGDITPHLIRQFLSSLERRGLSDRTVHKHARAIKTFCNFLVAEGLLDASPMDRVAMPKLAKLLPKPFSPADVKKLLKACKKSRTGVRDMAMILCLLDTGLRAAEFVSLNVGDVGRDGLIRVRGKGRKERYVRLGAQARKALLKYLAERGEVRDGDPLWAGQRGRLTVNGVYQAIKRLGKACGVWPVGLHRFRQTFAIWALRGGMDVYHLKAIMSWADLQMVQVYVELVKEDIEQAHREASPVDSFLGRRRR